MADKFKQFKSEIDSSLHDKSSPWTKPFEEAERKSGIDRFYIFIGLQGLVATWLIFGFSAQFVCNLLGFFFPAYASLQAIESGSKYEQKKWLSYWVIFGFFACLDSFSRAILSYFRFYWLLKYLILFWMKLPIENNGSIIIYNNLLKSYENDE